MYTTEHSFFAPELLIPIGTTNIDFYKNLGATEHFCLRNDDGSIHVAELELYGALFHLHESSHHMMDPFSANGVTAIIGLFVPNVHEVMASAIQAGATEINKVVDHDYGYRQGMFKDPFGHYWQVQKRI